MISEIILKLFTYLKTEDTGIVDLYRHDDITLLIRRRDILVCKSIGGGAHQILFTRTI